jgi:hypothetical protein
MKRFILAFMVGLLALTSCTSKLVSSASTETKKEVVKASDSFVKTTSEVITESAPTADSLIASVAFTENEITNQESQVIESGGMEITTSLERTDNGGLRVNIKSKTKGNTKNRTVQKQTTETALNTVDILRSDSSGTSELVKKKEIPNPLPLPDSGGGLYCSLRLDTECGGSINLI